MGGMTDDDEDDGAVDRVRKARKEADESGQSQWREDARMWYDFVAGEQWSEQDRAMLEAQLRAPVSFNRIGPMVDSVSGSEVNNRQQVQYIPRTLGDKRLNEVLTGAADYVRDNCDAEDEESDAFVDAVICGVGVTETRIDYEQDPEGAVLVERRDPLHMRWDPGAKKRNLMDRKWQQYDALLSRRDILARWPDAELIGSFDGGEPDGSPHDQDAADQYKRDASGYDRRGDNLWVTHHQWFEVEPFWQALDPGTGQIIDLTGAEHGKLQGRMKSLGMELQSVQKQRRKYMQAFVCGATVLQEGPIDCNRFTFHFITAKRDRNRGTWYGIVRPMIDPQKWANKFFSQILHIVNSNAKGGLVIEEDAVDNVRTFADNWSKADAISIVNSGAISGGKIMPKQPPVIPQALNDMLQFSISSMRDVTGINLELLGMADRQQAGIVEAQRKQAAMTVLASLFDGLRRYRKEQGRTLAAFISEYLSDGRLVRIVGGDGVDRYVPLTRDANAMKYDVVVDEAPASVNQREKTFAMLMQMLPNLQQMGVPFAPELLDYMPIPAPMAEKWKSAIQQAGQQINPQAVQQMQQAIQQLQQQLQQAQQQLHNKEAEISAGLQEASIKSDADMRARMQEAEVDARATYDAAILKAKLDAETALQKAIIDGQVKVAVAQVSRPPDPVAVEPAPPAQDVGQIVEGLQQVVSQFAATHADMTQRMERVIAEAVKKPRGFKHQRNADGFIEASVPVFDD